jgi:hypothetical protein
VRSEQPGGQRDADIIVEADAALEHRCEGGTIEGHQRPKDNDQGRYGQR